MTVLVNGQAYSQISALDRGLLYGQSVFETIVVSRGKAYMLEAHMRRLQKGAVTLGIPLDIEQLEKEIHSFVEIQNKAVLRVTVSMGEGGRGYRNPDSPAVTRILSLHDFPEHPESHWLTGIILGTAEIRLSHQPALAGIKHGNRLEQLIARTQWQTHWHEALLLDQQDQVIEATQSNVFAVKAGNLLTPSLANCGVAGVVRDFILTNADKLGLSVKIVSLSSHDFETADSIFVSNSVIGLWPVRQFNSRTFLHYDVAHKLLNLMIKNEVIPDYKT